MRRLINALAIASSCCLLLLSGCGTEEVSPSNPTNDAKQDAKQNNIVNPSQPSATLPGDQAPVVPTTPPVNPVPGTPAGGGGGSQGNERPADTGNPDNDPLEQPETLCADGEDNDEDGFIDCLDSNCAGQTCNDGNPCTVGDTCNAGVCAGAPRNCENEVGNECTVDVCEAIDSVDYRCVSSFDFDATDFGDCTPAGNCSSLNPDGSCATVSDSCVVGRCVFDSTVPIVFACESANLVDLTTDDIASGCNDENSCTADSCTAGVCLNGELSGTSCDDGSACTEGDTCVTGDCVGTAVGACFESADCPSGACSGATLGTCTVPPLTPCSDNSDCLPITGVCVGAVAGFCTCDDGNTCTTPDTCNGVGECVGDTTPEGPVVCEDGNDCTDDVCTAGVCVSTVDNTNDCDDGIACTLTDLCTGGNCAGAPDPTACDVDNDCLDCICTVDNGCECSQLTGPSDDECSIVLTTLALSADVLADLTALALPGACEVGLTACAEGVEGACELSAVFADTCTAATLDTACGTAVFALEANAELVTALCAELQALAAP